MKDIQNSPDTRGIAIDQVGVCDLLYPITVLDRENQKQQCAAKVSLSVSLPHHFKGTHMSRFLQVLAEHQGEFTMNTVPSILHDLKKRLDAETAHIEVEFPYFIQRKAPVSGLSAPMDYLCTFIGESNGTKDDFLLRVRVPVGTLCPCSKEISDYGAHNQRGYVTITTRTRKKPDGKWDFLWIEELVEVAEKSASAPIYPLLKRTDERHVTMQAYDNPVFVEDVVRNAAAQLQADSRIEWFEVRAVNHESIHNHSAFAVVTAGKIQVQLGGVNRVCWNEIQEAMLDDDLEKLADFLRRDPGCLEIRNESGLSLLQFYCLDGYFSKIAAFLLDHGADLEIKDQFGRTPLWHACNYIRENDGDETLNMLNELAYLLIDRGADVNSSDNDGVSVLHLAVAHHDYGLTRYLLVKGSDPNAKIEATDGLYNNSLILLDNHSGVPATVGSTPLHLSPGLAIAKLLVFYGADRHALDANGRLPHECASNPQVQKFLASTESGIDPGSNLSKSYQY